MLVLICVDCCRATGNKLNLLQIPSITKVCSQLVDPLSLATQCCCRPTSATYTAASSLATSCRRTCVTLITTLGVLEPMQTAAMVTQLLHWCHASVIQPPAELLHQLLESLCALAASPGGESYMKQAIKFLDAEEGGLLAHRRFQRDEILLVLQQLAVLAKAFLAAHGKKPALGAIGEVTLQTRKCWQQELKQFNMSCLAARRKVVAAAAVWPLIQSAQHLLI